jgi:hypothetical protein
MPQGAAEAALALLDLATAIVEPQVAAGKEGLMAGGLTTEVLEAVMEPQVAAEHLHHTPRFLQEA